MQHKALRPISIRLPDYRRAPNTSCCCIFTNCHDTTLRSNHLQRNSWNTQYEVENSISNFTVNQIQHIFSFVNPFKTTLDFVNVEDLDDSVLEYWIGLTKSQFTAIVEVPQIQLIRRGSLSLAALLIKMRTRDSNLRISSLKHFLIKYE